MLNYVKSITLSGLYMNNRFHMFRDISELYESNRHLRS